MSLSSELAFDKVCEALGFAKNPGFIRKDTPLEVQKQFRKWLELKDEFEIDALFLIQTTADAPSIPVALFKKLDKYDTMKIVELHKKIWNQGKIPLLYVILPSEVRIYNCFEPPCFSHDEGFDSENRLVENLRTLRDVEQIRRELSSYTCDKLSSGRFWREKGGIFDLNNRADMHLLNSLRTLRRVLQNEQLSSKFIHKLIGRLILLLCLEDRHALDRHFDEFKGGMYVNKGFREVLKNKDHTYELFEYLTDRFDGDIFPATAEEKDEVSDQHLQILRSFLLGTDLETHQTRLWPYRFDFIPIEFISNIYEEFIYYEQKPRLTDRRRQLGTYYTPQFLVDFMLDDILPWDTKEPYPKILDPSCGSGIFLVKAYRKLVKREMKISGNTTIRIEELKRILQKCIFGVDINSEAISITAFSLYLTMMDYIEPESLREQKGIFPKLINTNLFPVDFFDRSASFNKMRFDTIVGNVPWASVSRESNTRALSFCKYTHSPIGDKQIAQAFIWKALNLSRDGGEICLIVSAKSLLFNRKKTNIQFRQEFLRKSVVKTIVNLSPLRRSLFNKSVGPAAIVYCRKKPLAQERDLNSILYITPKSSLEMKYIGAIIIDESDYATVPLELALKDDSIWKTAMWGTPRDLELISRARSIGTLGEVVQKKRWEMGDGFRRRGDHNVASWLLDSPHIPAKSLDKYYIRKEDLKHLTDPIFDRPRDKKRYVAPLCLMKVTLKRGDLVAAFSDSDVSYTEGIIGISGSPEDADLLKIICCYLNSSVAKYFLFLTCSAWGVERDDIYKTDLQSLPLALPEKHSTEYKSLLADYDNIVRVLEHNEDMDELERCRHRIDSIFFELFNLSVIEKRLILDTIDYTIDSFLRKEKALATASVDDKMLREYVDNSLLLLNSIAKGTGKIFHSRIYSGSETLKVVSFMFRESLADYPRESMIEINNNATRLEGILDDLSPSLHEKRHENVFLRRIIRIYEGRTICLVKPNEKRYWTRIAAYKDADSILADIFIAWRGK